MRLESERKRRHWSRAELSRRTGMNPITIYMIEKGKQQPFPGQVAKLAEAFGYPADRANELFVEEVG